ncbi:MAG TPA: M56 family metallopeptidase [Rhodanobacteraceae bacterium]|nr:M56 family metallopeptidase [Rhodanobacteraceae bacterium]
MNAWAPALVVVQVVGWALLHFVWQAALIGILYALVRRCLPRGDARYLLGMLALAALALCPVLTAWRLSNAMTAITDTGFGPVSAVFGAAQGSTIQAMPDWQAALAAAMPWVVLAWATGVLLLSARVWRHWRRLRALVRAARVVPVWQERIRGLALRFGLHRGIRVLSSARVATPTLIGWVRPVILLPIAVSSGFPVAQVEMILAHELAHLRRLDHLANLFQVVLETLLFYHPVVHWISRDVRNERELCCDALALRVTGGSRREFATALVELEEFRERHAGLALAASGGVLLERIGQITGVDRDRIARQPGRFVGALSALLTIALMLALLWRQAELRRDLADSAVDVRHLLSSQLLPASIRMPMQTVANLIPQRLVVAPATLLRQPDDKAMHGDGIAPPVFEKIPLATPALRVADLDPGRLMLSGMPARAVKALPRAHDLPAPTHIEQPVYPLAAMEQGVEGKVVVEFSLDAAGDVREPTVVDAQPASIFDHAATHALLGWKFAPPAPGTAGRRYRQTFTFTLHPGSDVAGREIPARAGCYEVTGSHICRSRGLDEAFVSGVVH